MSIQGLKFYLLAILVLIVISVFFLFPSFHLAFSIDEYNNFIYKNNPAFMGIFNPYGFQLWSFNFLYDFLGLEPKPYFLLGFLLRILSSAGIIFLTFNITKNKMSSLLAGVIFALGFTGIQTTSEPVNMNVYLALFSCTIFIYYFFRSRKYFTVKNLLFMEIFLLISILISPIRMNPLFIWAFLADLIWLGIDYSKSSLRKFLIRMGLIFSLLFVLIKLGSFNFGVYGQNTFINTAFQSLNRILLSFSKGDFTYLSDILIGIGNIIFPNQYNILATSFGTNLSFLLGIVYVVILIIVFIKFIHQRSEGLLILLTFLMWAPIFYLLQWVVSLTASSESVISSFRRYLLPAFLGISISFAYGWFLIINSKRKLIIKLISILLFLFVLFHAVSTFKFLNYLNSYADGEYVEKIWDQLAQQVPSIPSKGEKVSIFYFEVEDQKARYATDNAFSQRAVMLYKIPQDPYKLNPNPLPCFYFEELLSYLDGSRLIQLGFKDDKAEPVTWDRVFAFKVQGDRLINIKQEVREKVERTRNK